MIWLNTLRPRQNGRHFPYDIFKCISFNKNASISLSISLKCVPKVRINNIPTLVQIMAWCRPGDKPLSEPVMVRLPTHTCVTWPQWVNMYSLTVSMHSPNHRRSIQTDCLQPTESSRNSHRLHDPSMQSILPAIVGSESISHKMSYHKISHSLEDQFLKCLGSSAINMAIHL